MGTLLSSVVSSSLFVRLHKLIMATMALAFVPGMATAQDIERGRLLYETFCVSCHDRSMHSRKQRIAKCYSDIRAQVYRWQSNVGQTRNKSEIEDVTRT